MVVALSSPVALAFGAADHEIVVGVLSFLLIGPFLFFVAFALWRGIRGGNDSKP